MTNAATIDIRDATESDVASIHAIYCHYVLNSTCTFDIACPPLDPTGWIAQHSPEYPAIVACEGDAIVGWATLSPYRSRCAYTHTVENSVYIHHDHHRRGIGRRLMSEILRRAIAIGHHAVIGAIAGDQPASIGLHESLGFTRVGCLREVGYKFGCWIDVVFMERILSS